MSNDTIDKVVEALQSLPPLHPDELAEIRAIAGRPDLTNDDAQLLIHEITAWKAYLDFEQKGHGPLR